MADPETAAVAPISEPGDAAEASTPEPGGEAAPAKPPAATTVVLVRHGVTEETGPILSGRRPGIGLSEKGRGQAEAAGRRLADLPVAAVYSSPLERCRETAEAVAAPHGLPVHDVPELFEADYGEWSGRKIEELRGTDLWKLVQVTPSAVRFPGGESVREMQSRIIGAVEDIVAAHPGQIVVAASHADPIKAVVAHSCCTVLRFGPAGAALVKLNDTGSLDELRPPDPKSGEVDTAAGATTDPGATLAPSPGLASSEGQPARA